MDNDVCVAEEIDGALETSMCGCDDCHQLDHDRIDSDNEMGYLTDSEALAAHAELDAGGGCDDDDE